MTHISSLGHEIVPSQILPQDNSFTLIQNFIDQSKNTTDQNKIKEAIDDAIDHLIVAIIQIHTTPDFIKAYEYISQLLPAMKEDIVQTLISKSQQFCQKTSHLSKEQEILAFQLASWYENLALNHCPLFLQKFSAYREALYYSIKAIQISNHRKYHENASEILMQALLKASLNYLFHNIGRASQLGDPEKFEELIHQIKPLELLSSSLYWGRQPSQLIGNLYRDITRLILKTPQASEEKFQPYLSLTQAGTLRIQQYRLVNTAPEEYPTEKYFHALQLFRQTFDQMTEGTLASKEITLALRKLINVFLSDLFTIVGPPPCGYDLRAMGSVGREEMCRFSDLEIMILIEKEEYSSYFDLLLKLLNLQICSLGESEASENQMIFTCANAKNFSGLHLDIGDSCIKTPAALANLQRTSHNDPATFAHMALFSVSLSSNTEELFKHYSQYLSEIFKETPKEEIAIGKAQALRFIKARTDDDLKPNYLEDIKDLKKNYAQPLNLLLADMALYWDIPHSNTQEIINALEEKKIFTPESCKILQRLSSAIYQIRNKLHTHYQKQKEEAFVIGCTTQERYVLLPEEKQILECCEYLALKPLYALLTQAFQKNSLKEQNQDFITLFSQVDLVKIALKNLLLEKTPIHTALKKLSIHVNNSQHMHASLKAILQEKQCTSFKLYEEFGLSVAQAVDLIFCAWNLKKTIFLTYENKSVRLDRKDLQAAQFEALSINSAFYIQLLIKLSLFPLGQRLPLNTAPYQDGPTHEIQRRLGKELKALLTSFNPVTVAQWADNVHLPNLSSELSDMLESLSLMSLGKEFEYSKEALLTLAEQLINHQKGFLQQLQNSVFK